MPNPSSQRFISWTRWSESVWRREAAAAVLAAGTGDRFWAGLEHHWAGYVAGCQSLSGVWLKHVHQQDFNVTSDRIGTNL
jgi:hypothetical protein